MVFVTQIVQRPYEILATFGPGCGSVGEPWAKPKGHLDYEASPILFMGAGYDLAHRWTRIFHCQVSGWKVIFFSC